MAVLVITGAKVQVGTAWTGTAPGTPGTQTVSGTISSPTDMSAMCRAITLGMAVAPKDATNFGSGGYVVNVSGLKSSTMQLTFNQDFASSQVDQTIWTTLGLGSTAYIDIQPAGGTRSATSPSYVYAALVTSYPVVSQAVGDLVTVQASWTVTGKFDRLTS